eukprot:g19361.t1
MVGDSTTTVDASSWTIGGTKTSQQYLRESSCLTILLTQHFRQYLRNSYTSIFTKSSRQCYTNVLTWGRRPLQGIHTTPPVTLSILPPNHTASLPHPRGAPGISTVDARSTYYPACT